MDKDEALKLALEALELHGKQYPHMVKGYCLDAITAIKQALALDKKAENARELGLDYEPADGTQVSKVWWDGEKLMAKPIPLEDIYQPVQEPWSPNDAAHRPGGLPQDFIKHEVELFDDWSEWVNPKAEQYFMKCCDCGLVHEMQFKVAKYAEGDACEFVEDADLQAVFRARRTTPPAAQPAPVQDVDWKDMYEKEKRRSEMWVAKYEKDIGPLEYAIPAAPVQEPVGCEGAIVNGRVYADRLEHDYKFECEAGPLHLCNDWVEFRRCFEWLAEHATPPAKPAPVQEPVATLFGSLPVYDTTPPAAQRQWVGLTDDDIEQEFGFIDELLRDCVYRTEAKVREKNT